MIKYDSVPESNSSPARARNTSSSNDVHFGERLGETLGERGGAGGGWGTRLERSRDDSSMFSGLFLWGGGEEEMWGGGLFSLVR